jgi:hypothetical protein
MKPFGDPWASCLRPGIWWLHEPRSQISCTATSPSRALQRKTRRRPARSPGGWPSGSSSVPVFSPSSPSRSRLGAGATATSCLNICFTPTSPGLRIPECGSTIGMIPSKRFHIRIARIRCRYPRSSLRATVSFLLSRGNWPPRFLSSLEYSPLFRPCILCGRLPSHTPRWLSRQARLLLPSSAYQSRILPSHLTFNN